MPDDQMHPYTAPAKYSECSPYHMALYLHSLIKSADHLVDVLDGSAFAGTPTAAEVGLSGLLTVIRERADALEIMLSDMDEPEIWAHALEAVKAKRSAEQAEMRAITAARATIPTGTGRA